MKLQLTELFAGYAGIAQRRRGLRDPSHFKAGATNGQEPGFLRARFRRDQIAFAAENVNYRAKR